MTFASGEAAEAFRALVDALGVERALKAYAADQATSSLTVAELAERFLERKAADVTPRTLADYRRDYANWIEPWFGHREAESVDEGDVQRWVDHMSTKLARKSVGDRHMLLHSIYQFGKAKSRRLVTHNPCLETEFTGPKGRKKPKGTTTHEWRALLAAAKAKRSPAHDLILFMGSLGWRWSEAAALAARDVEDDGAFVWVDVTQVFRIVENRQVLVPDAAKSWAGFRRTRVPSECAAMLRRRVAGLAPDALVFTNSRGNHWNQNTFLRDTWPGLLAEAKVGTPDRKPTPHWLRHMAVANMARAGIPMHEIQRIIGHESLETTNGTYGGMVATLSAAGVAQLDAVLAHDARTVAGEVVTGELG